MGCLGASNFPAASHLYKVMIVTPRNFAASLTVKYSLKLTILSTPLTSLYIIMQSLKRVNRKCGIYPSTQNIKIGNHLFNDTHISAPLTEPYVQISRIRLFNRLPRPVFIFTAFLLLSLFRAILLTRCQHVKTLVPTFQCQTCGSIYYLPTRFRSISLTKASGKPLIIKCWLTGRNCFSSCLKSRPSFVTALINSAFKALFWVNTA